MKKEMICLIFITILFFNNLAFAYNLEKSKDDILKDNNSKKLNFINPSIDKLCFMIHKLRLRTYWVHIPSTYNGDSAVPLVILLHPYGKNGQLISNISEMNLKSDKEGFIAIYPNGATYGKDKGWNAGFCCGPALKRNIDDLGFIKKILDITKKGYNIDNDKIYIAGFSNGGMMAYRFAAEFSNEIAAIAVVSAQLGGNISDFRDLWIIPKPSGPLSVIIFHGTKDKVVPYDGGKCQCKKKYVEPFLPTYISINESVSFWIENNECDPIPKINVISDGNVIIRKYDNGTNGTEVIFYTILNGDHYWFGGAPLPNTKNDPFNYISATDIIWDFFKDHEKI